MQAPLSIFPKGAFTDHPLDGRGTPLGPSRPPSPHPGSKGSFAPAGAPRAALERAPWTPRNFSSFAKKQAGAAAHGAAAPLHSVLRVAPSRVKG